MVNVSVPLISVSFVNEPPSSATLPKSESPFVVPVNELMVAALNAAISEVFVSV
jgi:hypothetical protein